MSTARLPRKLKILGLAAATVWLGASLMAAANPPVPRAAITVMPGSLAAVSTGSATDAWAVGKTGTQTAQKTLALHWDGTTWAQAPTPSPGQFGSFLSGVTEISPANVWAVGSANTSSGSTSLVLHWDGTTWAQVPTPSAGVSGLTGISAVSATDIWAVGTGGTSTKETTLVLHWNGTTWTRVPGPALPGQPVLNAVSADSATDAWAVGRDFNNAGTLGKTLILHWDGTSWTQVPSPDPGVHDNQLFGVHMTSATDGWAAGYADNSQGDDLSLVLHWDGTSWTQVPSPTVGLNNGGTQLTGVSALTGTDAWASGTFFTPGGEGTVLLHWDGTAWTRVPAPSPSPGGPTGGSSVEGVAMTATADVWSAGETLVGSTPKQRTLLLHWNGTAWTRF